MKWLRGGIVALATLGILVPQLALGAKPVANPKAHTVLAKLSPKARDAVLQKNGVLSGQVLDKQAKPVAKASVVLVHQGQLTTAAKTDANGKFSVAGVKPGVYQVVTDHGVSTYRVFDARTAPKTAKSTVVVVNDAEVVRGALGGGGLLALLANPWVIAGLIATAIAVPLAIDAADDDAS